MVPAAELIARRALQLALVARVAVALEDPQEMEQLEKQIQVVVVVVEDKPAELIMLAVMEDQVLLLSLIPVHNNLQVVL